MKHTNHGKTENKDTVNSKWDRKRRKEDKENMRWRKRPMDLNPAW